MTDDTKKNAPLSDQQIRDRVSTLVRDSRTKAKRGVREVARAVGIDKETLRRIETGISIPTLAVARRLCVELNLDPAEVLCLTKPKKKSRNKRN